MTDQQLNIDQMVILLSSGIAQRRLYFAEHPKIKDLGGDFIAHLGKYLKATEQESLFIGVFDGKLVHDGHFLVGPSIAGGQLIKFSGLLHSGGFLFHEDVTAQEISSFLGLAAETKEELASLAEGRALFEFKGIVNINPSAIYQDFENLVREEDKTIWKGQDQSLGHLDSPILVYQALFDVVTSAHGSAALNRTLDIDNARSVSEYLLQSTQASFTDIIQMMHYPDYDSYTVGHSVRVATLAVHLGSKLGLNDEELQELGTAGLLHDVGKSKIPDEILFKPGRLDNEEFDIMKSHARLGAEILMEHHAATALDVAAAWGHHLRYDGGGYPDSPAWAVRNNLTALLQVCDVFEALTSIRPYKAPMSPRKAYEIMLENDGAFHPGALHVFIRTLGMYPPGNPVRLNDGSQGTVIDAGVDIERPLIRLTQTADGQAIGVENDIQVDLGAPGSQKLAVEELLGDWESVLA